MSKVAIVTAASMGMGKACAAELVQSIRIDGGITRSV